jgi:small subunit ribosomal protein S4
MARYRSATCKLSRREGVDLQLKSPIRPLDSKCKLTTPPGQHGLSRKKVSGYGIQFREKQKAKRVYGVLEKQFRSCYEKARKIKGNTASNLMYLLERRLDNVVYRMGFATTRAEARQIVGHKGVLVNGALVNIASYLVSVGDVVAISNKAKKHLRIQHAIEVRKQVEQSQWVSVDYGKLEGEFVRLPEDNELGSFINESLIVELYSK